MTAAPSSMRARPIVWALLVVSCVPAWSQTDTQRVASACQASLQQMYQWCGKQQQPGFLAGSNCSEATTNVTRFCYHEGLPQLGCAAAQRENELWCGGNSNFSGFLAGSKCGESQNKVRSYCFR